VIIEMVALGDRDLTGENDHKAGSDMTGGPERFTGQKRAHVAKPAYPLDF